MSAAGTLEGVQWGELKHAFGPASDLPDLLAAISKARGGKLLRKIGDLCERVLHQGTIYSASPPAVHELIAMAAKSGARDKAVFYEVLAEFASAARQAIRDGRAIPCCSGGDPADGTAILCELLAARDLFAPDLEHADPIIRGMAGTLLTPSIDADPAAVALVRNRYSVETDPAARLRLLKGLIHTRARFAAWPEFLATALERETDPSNRLALRHAQVWDMKTDASEEAVNELIATFVQSGSIEGRFFDALHLLGAERELTALLQTLDGASEINIARTAAEHLLRLVFHDQRTGWGQTSYSIEPDGETPQANAGGPNLNSMFKAVFKMLLLAMLWKMFPFLLRRKLKKAASKRRGKEKIEYWGLEGAAPEVPAVLTSDQRRVLNALAGKPAVWEFRTNLWELFGLPDSAAGLRQLLES